MEKKIEEMAIDLRKVSEKVQDRCDEIDCRECGLDPFGKIECKYLERAKMLLEKGYRKELDVLIKINDIINELKTEIETAETSLIDEGQKISCLAVLMLLQTKIMKRYGVRDGNKKANSYEP
jgi:hypothetical protein